MFGAYQGEMFSFIANHLKRCIAFGLVVNLATDGKYLLVELQNKIGSHSMGVEDVPDKISQAGEIGMQNSLLGFLIELLYIVFLKSRISQTHFTFYSTNQEPCIHGMYKVNLHCSWRKMCSFQINFNCHWKGTH